MLGMFSKYRINFVQMLEIAQAVGTAVAECSSNQLQGLVKSLVRSEDTRIPEKTSVF
jgi:replication initiation and membrane attachment protein DnaB